MAQPLNADASRVPSVGAVQYLTLVSGRTFCLSHPTGDIAFPGPDGLFYVDTRLVSALMLRLEGYELEHLSDFTTDPNSAVFVSRPRALDSAEPILVVRRRYIGSGLREEVEVRNLGRRPARHRVSLQVDSDFAHIFSVKSGRPVPAGELERRAEGGRLWLARKDGSAGIEIESAQPPASLQPEEGLISWDLEIAAQQSWATCIEIRPVVQGTVVATSYPCGEPVAHSVPLRRLASWRSRVPAVACDDTRLVATVAQSLEDLAALRIFDPIHPDRAVIAAGAPWFMTLFGRDSILTAWMALPFAPELARGVLLTLADLQGANEDTETEEQPGRILHEVRQIADADLDLYDGDIYFGTADATPLFVMLVAEAWRWGAISDELPALMAHVVRALDWIERHGDIDGDGYVEYQRRSPRGLENQGWKDSWDGINFADGRLPEAPIALVEVQGYVYAAYRAAADMFDHLGDAESAARWRGKAADLAAAFERDFWLPDRQMYALGLDGQKRPIDALATNYGHALWTGIVADSRAGGAVASLCRDSMFSGWGLRTLDATMAAYDPLSYHNGSVWPHDNAVVAAGLARYGFHAEVHRIADALLDVAVRSDNRLPELFSGLPRDDIAMPVAYPSSCSPQAWAAGAPLLLLRAMLGIDVDVPSGHLTVRPHLPRWIGDLRLTDLPLANGTIDIHVTSAGALTVDTGDLGLRIG